MVNVNKIKVLAKNQGVSLTYIIKKIGLQSPTYFNDIQKHGRDISDSRLKIIADILRTTPENLRDESDESEKNGVKIPVIGISAAGLPAGCDTQCIDESDSDTWEEITEQMAATGEYVAVRIRGDSMEPRIYDGDIVIVSVQDDVSDNEIAIVIVNGDTATCKRVHKTPSSLILTSINPKYPPMVYTPKQVIELPVRIFGRVVELRAKM